MDSILFVGETLRKSYAAAKRPSSVLVGVSGGADSVALLLSLCELRTDEGLNLHAVHVNHGLRENAVQDEVFCRELCCRLDVPLSVVQVAVSPTGSLEAAAREARYKAFEEVKRACGAQVLALAHHADDQAETVVMHLLYGTGATGLGGMRETTNTAWRPFLHIRRKQLQEYLEARGQNWREDESNADTAFTRNRIRAKVMPVLEACSAACVGNMGRTAEILQAENDFLECTARQWLEENASDGTWPFVMTRSLINQHPAMQRRILRQYALRLGIVLDYAATERLRSVLEAKNGTIENLPGCWRALKCAERLHFLPPEDKVSEGRTIAGELRIDDIETTRSIGCSQRLPAEQANGLCLRTRQPGDYIQPFGMTGRKSLKEYMIDCGMDRPFRDAWPLVCRGSEVLWVVGFGASEKLRVSPDEPDVKILIFQGKLPDEYGRKK